MKTADIVIIGSGSLATGLVYALSQISAGPLRIAIIGRSNGKISRIALVACARAASFGIRSFFFPFLIPQFTELAFARAFRSLKPKVILLAASLQSSWESSQSQNAWTKLVATAGFGITLPMQLQFAADVSRAAADSEAAIINACYPDCVNVVLHRLGFRTTCGIGNSAIVEAFCRARHNVGSKDVRVVGHHGHLAVWLKGNRSQSQPRIWINDKEKKSLQLRPDLGPIQDELNNVTSATATKVIMSLVSAEALQTSIPGVAGLPGGYPFVLQRGKFTLQLPAGITCDQAIAHNKTGERLDGLDLGSDVKFVGKARHVLSDVGFDHAAGFNVAEWQTVCTKMLALRDRLRHTQPQ